MGSNILTFPTVGENMYRKWTAISQPITGSTGEGEEDV